MVSSLEGFLSSPSLACGCSGYQCRYHEGKEAPFLTSWFLPPSPYCEASSSWHVAGVNEDHGRVPVFYVFSPSPRDWKRLS